MNRATAVCVALLALAFVPDLLLAADTDKRLLDRSRLEISTGTAAITTTSANFTTWQPCLTIAPDGAHALADVKVVVDLAKATTGFAATYTSETITFTVARKVDGTNWRSAGNKATTAVSGTNAAALCVELDLGVVGPDEQVRVELKLSAEGNSNTELPYVLYYRGGTRATVTPSS